MKSRSSPSPRSSAWKVWQCALIVPGTHALPARRTSPACAAPTSCTATMRPSAIATARSASQPVSVRTRSARSLMDDAAARDDRPHVVDAIVVGEEPPVGNIGEEHVALLAGSQRADLVREPHRVGAMQRDAERALAGGRLAGD